MVVCDKICWSSFISGRVSSNWNQLLFYSRMLSALIMMRILSPFLLTSNPGCALALFASVPTLRAFNLSLLECMNIIILDLLALYLLRKAIALLMIFIKLFSGYFVLHLAVRRWFHSAVKKLISPLNTSLCRCTRGPWYRVSNFQHAWGAGVRWNIRFPHHLQSCIWRWRSWHESGQRVRGELITCCHTCSLVSREKIKQCTPTAQVVTWCFIRDVHLFLDKFRFLCAH